MPVSSRLILTLDFAAEVTTPMVLLEKIGRNADKRLTTQAESWEKLSELWNKGGPALEAAGLKPKDRRYVPMYIRIPGVLMVCIDI